MISINLFLSPCDLFESPQNQRFFSPRPSSTSTPFQYTKQSATTTALMDTQISPTSPPRTAAGETTTAREQPLSTPRYLPTKIPSIDSSNPSPSAQLPPNPRGSGSPQASLSRVDTTQTQDEANYTTSRTLTCIRSRSASPPRKKLKKTHRRSRIPLTESAWHTAQWAGKEIHDFLFGDADPFDGFQGEAERESIDAVLAGNRQGWGVEEGNGDGGVSPKSLSRGMAEVDGEEEDNVKKRKNLEGELYARDEWTREIGREVKASRRETERGMRGTTVEVQEGQRAEKDGPEEYVSETFQEYAQRVARQLEEDMETEMAF